MLNKRIKELRMDKGISQVRLANDLGVSKQTVSNWENNNSKPSIEMLLKLSDYFSKSTDYLLGLENKKYIEVTGLSNKEISHIEEIINDIKK